MKGTQKVGDRVLCSTSDLDPDYDVVALALDALLDIVEDEVEFQAEGQSKSALLKRLVTTVGLLQGPTALLLGPPSPFQPVERQLNTTDIALTSPNPPAFVTTFKPSCRPPRSSEIGIPGSSSCSTSRP